MINDGKFKKLISNFKFKGKFVKSNCHECGHINDTFILDFEDEKNNGFKYVLQRINCDIFKCPEELMENIKHVTKHISDKVKEANGNPLRETLNLIPTVDGKTYFITEDGNYWRAFNFIDGASTYQIVENPKHFYTCGKALGKFQKQLSDFPVSDLYETIPDFHNTAKRYRDFLEAVNEDKANRVKDIGSEIDFIMSREKETSILVDMIDSNELPLRVTHNDTKFNNIMIDDNTGEGVAVIDLDTVMPGLALYDFGDSIRSGATTALEDEVDLSKVNFDIGLFEQFTKGFLEEVGECFTENEIKYLAFSAKLITFECGMRFLTDYINGDTYFKIQRENHNLDRARNQFKLVSDMEEQMEEMDKIVRKYC